MRPVACIAAAALALGTFPGQAAAQNRAARGVQILRDHSEPATQLISSIRGGR
jgi:hypothetical protein